MVRSCFMYGYFDAFPRKLETELRTVRIEGDAKENDPLCGATFLFFEYYCIGTFAHRSRK